MSRKPYKDIERTIPFCTFVLSQGFFNFYKNNLRRLRFYGTYMSVFDKLNSNPYIAKTHQLPAGREAIKKFFERNLAAKIDCKCLYNKVLERKLDRVSEKTKHCWGCSSDVFKYASKTLSKKYILSQDERPEIVELLPAFGKEIWIRNVHDSHSSRHYSSFSFTPGETRSGLLATSGEEWFKIDIRKCAIQYLCRQLGFVRILEQIRQDRLYRFSRETEKEKYEQAKEDGLMFVYQMLSGKEGIQNPKTSAEKAVKTRLRNLWKSMDISKDEAMAMEAYIDDRIQKNDGDTRAVWAETLSLENEMKAIQLKLSTKERGIYWSDQCLRVHDELDIKGEDNLKVAINHLDDKDIIYKVERITGRPTTFKNVAELLAWFP